MSLFHRASEEHLHWVPTESKELEYDAKISCKLEVWHDATNPMDCLPNRHIGSTNTMSRFRLLKQKRMWDLKGIPASVVTNKGRGRGATKSSYRNNYDCQVNNNGTLRS